jgi:hypothetical protein
MKIAPMVVAGLWLALPTHAAAQAFHHIDEKIGTTQDFDFEPKLSLAGFELRTKNLTKIRRSMNDPFVEFVYDTGAVRLPMVGDAISDAQHDCIVDGFLQQPNTFVLERFRTVLPAAAGNGHLLKAGSDQFFFGQPVCFIVNGPTTTPNGAFAQVIQSAKFTVTRGASTWELLPKPSKAGLPRVPRFDGQLAFFGQARLKRDRASTPDSIILWDSPGFISVSEGDFSGFSLKDGDTLRLEAQFHTFSFADCDEDGQPELATYRIDWSHDDTITVKKTAATTTAAARPAPPAPTFKAIPTGADFKPFTDAEANDPGPSKGWKPSKATIDVIQIR